MHCDELLGMPFEMVYEISQSLPFVGQPTRNGHMGKILIGHRTLMTSHC